ncbi:ABC transporter substrate-binding protein [Nonomuraea sp. NPDC050536]|uniref:ABC transporter substrate-binding protein n=1 Tax=Nonomuraea sp. NPDC050536 TaxID=3364366 RepID=UPI0037C77D87
MRYKRLLTAGLVVGIALVAGCSAPNTDGAGKGSTVTLTYMTFETPSLTSTFWDASIANATKQVPGLTIKKVVAPSTDRDAFAKQLKASGQFPDLLQSITPSTFVSAGLLKPYDQAWVDANFLLPQGNALKGKVYIPPTNSQVIPEVFYNKKLFARAGIAATPKTWSEFMALCAKLKAAGITPIELGGGDPFAASMPLVGILSADVLGKNPQWLQDRYAGKVRFTDPDVVSAAQKYRDMVKAGYFEDGALGVKYADSIKNFTDGKTAMYIMGSWFLGSVPKDHADDFGAFLTPTEDGSTVVPFAVGGSMAVSAKSVDPAKATQFAQAWSLNAANLKSLIEGDGAFPMLKGKTLADYNVDVTRVFKDSYAYVTDQNTKVSAFGWATNDDSMPPGLNDAFYAASQALFTSDDVKGALTKVDTAWNNAVE